MSDKVEISKINFEIEGQKISVTPEGAKKLRTLLNDLFGKDIQIIEKNNYYPYWWQTNQLPKYWDNGIVYCQDTSAKIHFASFSVNNHMLDFKVLE